MKKEAGKRDAGLGTDWTTIIIKNKASHFVYRVKICKQFSFLFRAWKFATSFKTSLPLASHTKLFFMSKQNCSSSKTFIVSKTAKLGGFFVCSLYRDISLPTKAGKFFYNLKESKAVSFLFLPHALSGHLHPHHTLEVPGSIPSSGGHASAKSSVSK